MPDGTTFDYAAARKAGYSDTEIQSYLHTNYGFNFDITSARKSGYSDNEINTYLSKQTLKKKVGGTDNGVDVSTPPVNGLQNLKTALSKLNIQPRTPSPFGEDTGMKPIDVAANKAQEAKTLKQATLNTAYQYFNNNKPLLEQLAKTNKNLIAKDAEGKEIKGEYDLNQLQKTYAFQKKLAEIANAHKNGILAVDKFQSGKNVGKPVLAKAAGFWESVGNSISHSVSSTKDAIVGMFKSPSELADYYDEQRSKLPEVPESTPTGIGSMIGGAIGGIIKPAAEFAVGETIQPGGGGLITAAADIIPTTTSEKTKQLYYERMNALESKYGKGNVPENERINAITQAKNDAPIQAIPEEAMQLYLFGKGAGNIANETAIKSFNKTLLKAGGDIEKMYALGGTSEAATQGIKSAQGYDTKDADKAIGDAALNWAAMETAFKILPVASASKYIKSSAKEVLTTADPEVIQKLSDEAVQKGWVTQNEASNIQQDLTQYAKIKQTLPQDLPADKTAAVTGLLQKNENLEAEKKARNPITHDDIDAEIKANETKAKNILNSNQPLKHETDNLTGERGQDIGGRPTKQETETQAKEIPASENNEAGNSGNGLISATEKSQTEKGVGEAIQSQQKEVMNNDEADIHLSKIENDNKYVDKLSNEDLSKLKNTMLSDENYFKSKYEDSQHLFNVIDDKLEEKQTPLTTSNEGIVEGVENLKKELNDKIAEVENPKQEIKFASSDKNKIIEKINKIGNPKVGDVLNIGGTKWVVNKVQKRQTFQGGKYSDADGYRINITSNDKGVNMDIYSDTNEFIKHEKTLSDIDKIERLKDEYDQKITALKPQKNEGIVENKQPISKEDFHNNILQMAEGMKDSNFDWRLTIPEMSQKEREQAVNDIRAGKNSKAAQRLKAYIDDAYDKNVITLNRGRGNNAQTVDFPLKEWFGEPLTHEELNHAEKIDDATAEIINDEGITANNIDNLKHLFNGFPYEQSDFQKVKNYLARQDKSSTETKGNGTQGENEILTNKSNNNAIPEQSPSSLLQHPQEGVRETGGGRERMESSEQGNETTGTRTQEEGATPSEEKINIHAEYPPTSLNYSGTGKLETEFPIDKRQPTQVKHDIETIKEADNLIEKGWKPRDAIDRVESGEAEFVSDAEYINLTRYGAELSHRLRNIKDIDSPEYDKTLKELNRVANVANIAGKETGRALGIRGRFKTVQDGTYADFMLTELAANNDVSLTHNQKETANEQWNKFEEARLKFEQDKKTFDDEVARFRAEQEVGKIKKSSSKNKPKTHEQHAAYRKGEVEKAREALKKLRTGESGLSAVPLPGVRELIAIAPHVKNVLGDLLEEGAIKLVDAIDRLHEEFKEFGVTKRNIHDIIAGEYNEKKPTKTDVAIAKENLRIEAQLLNKYEKLLKQPVPKNEKVLRKRTAEIEELRNQIKEFKNEEREASQDLKKEQRDEEKEANIRYKENVPDEVKKLQSIKRRNENETKRLNEIIAKGDFSPEEKKIPALQNPEYQKAFPNLYKKVIQSNDDLIKVRNDVAIRRAKWMYEHKTDKERTEEVIGKTLNIPRTLMTIGDFSAVFRQAAVATSAHPIIASKALKFMFEAAASEKVYNRWLDQVHNDPLWATAEKSKLPITDPQSLHAKEHEEAFYGSQYAEQIPGVGYVVKASERAYNGYLNFIRWEMFKMYATKFEKQGKTYENNKKLYEGISSFVGSATGRGGMKFGESAAPLLNGLLFASRLIAARVNMLGLTDIPNLIAQGGRYAVKGATLGKFDPKWGLDYGFYTRLPKEIRVLAAIDMAKFVGVGIATLFLAKQMGADVEVDPRSSDFGKIHDGNTRWDIWGGFQPYARLTAQIISGQSKSANTGKVYDLDGSKYGGRTIGDQFATFGRGKLAPIWGITADYLTRRTLDQQTLERRFDIPFYPKDNPQVGKITLTDELLKSITPLLSSDIIDAYKDRGVRSLYEVGIPSLFGIGVQTYSPKVSTSGSTGREKRTTEHRETREHR